jgi:hypothetical protein
MARKAKKVARKTKKAVVFDDLSTQADDQVSPNSFAEAVSGPHEGRYGSVEGLNNEGDVILRTRDDLSERILVAPEDLRPAQAGRR